MKHKVTVINGVRDVPDPLQVYNFRVQEHDGTATASCTCGKFQASGERLSVLASARAHYEENPNG